MNKRIKNLWIKALESGKYRQTTGQLKELSTKTSKKPKYCCLGVLCDICSKEKGIKWNKEIFCGVGGTLPIEVRDWANLNSNDPLVGDQHLTSCNDASRMKFKEIAKLIKKYL